MSMSSSSSSDNILSLDMLLATLPNNLRSFFLEDGFSDTASINDGLNILASKLEDNILSLHDAI